MPALLQHYSDFQKHPPPGDAVIPVQRNPISATSVPWAQLTFFDFVAGMRVKRSEGGGHEPISRNKPAIVGHVNFDPDKSAEQFYYSKILMHTVWRDPGDWLQAEDEGKHIKAFHRLLQTEPDFLSSRCFPTMDATLEAARALAKVQAEMYLRAQIDNVTEEEKFKGHMQIMD
eukprot:3056761-Amphidinium_carterae.1